MSAPSVPSVPRKRSQLSRRKQASHPSFVSVRALLNRARDAAGRTDSAKTSARQLGSALWEEWKKNDQRPRVQLGIFKLAQDQAKLLRMGQQTALPNQIVEKCRDMQTKDAEGEPFPIYEPKLRKPVELKNVVRSEQSARACLAENLNWNRRTKKEMVKYWEKLRADARLQTRAYRILKAEQAEPHRTSSEVLKDLAALVEQLPKSPSPRVSPVASRSHTASSNEDDRESSDACSGKDGYEKSSDEDGDEYGSDRVPRPSTPRPRRGCPSGLVSHSPSTLRYEYHPRNLLPESPSSRVSPVASRSHTASIDGDDGESSDAYSDEDGHEKSSDEDGDEYGSNRDSRSLTPHPRRGSPSGLVSYSPSSLPFVYHASSSASGSSSPSPRAAVPDETHRNYVPLEHRLEFDAFANTGRARRDYHSIGRRAAHIYGTTRERWAAGEGW